jgi:hypothetical protein
MSTETSAKKDPNDPAVEERIVTIRAHWRHLAFPIGYSALSVALLAWLALTVLGNFWGRALLAVLAMVGLAAWVRLALAPFVQWFTKSYTVTGQRVLFHDSIKAQRQVELAKISLPTQTRTGLDVLFRSGTLDLGGGYVLERIPRVKKTATLISELYSSRPKDVQELQILLSRLGY